jgi:hypothetical protein
MFHVAGAPISQIPVPPRQRGIDDRGGRQQGQPAITGRWIRKQPEVTGSGKRATSGQKSGHPQLSRGKRYIFSAT